MATLERPDILSPSFTASSTSCAGGKTLLTRPAVWASWADILSPGEGRRERERREREEGVRGKEGGEGGGSNGREREEVDGEKRER